MFYSALVGNPVEHSISPIFFNYIAKELNIEYSHIKICIENKNLLGESINSLNLLGFCGLNITIPYKIDIVKHIDILDKSAISINSVNTIKFKEGKSIGYNTDGIAAIKSIEKFLRPINHNDKILIIGAGGAARPIFYEINKKTKNIVIMNRCLKESENMIKLINKNIKCYKLEEQNYIKNINEANFIINTTPVGMYPKFQRLISKNVWESVKHVNKKNFFDVIFNPYETEFLSDAKNIGGKTCSGLIMMIYQILEVFELWTNIRIKNFNVKEVEKVLLDKLNRGELV